MRGNVDGARSGSRSAAGALTGVGPVDLIGPWEDLGDPSNKTRLSAETALARGPGRTHAGGISRADPGVVKVVEQRDWALSRDTQLWRNPR